MDFVAQDCVTAQDAVLEGIEVDHFVGLGAGVCRGNQGNGVVGSVWAFNNGVKFTCNTPATAPCQRRSVARSGCHARRQCRSGN